MRFFSYRQRPVHLGPWPLERLARAAAPRLPPEADATPLPPLRRMQPLDFNAPELAATLAPAIGRYMAMFDLVRDGAVNAQRAEVPADPGERARHLKAAGYYFDASMMALCRLPAAALLAEPIRNPHVPALGAELEANQPVSFAAGMDMILADVLESARKVHGPIAHHTHALVIAVEYPRAPLPGEPGKPAPRRGAPRPC
jgi:hypothetical protein